MPDLLAEASPHSRLPANNSFDMATASASPVPQLLQLDLLARVFLDGDSVDDSANKPGHHKTVGEVNEASVCLPGDDIHVL